MRRNRRRHISDLFYNTGDLNARTIDESIHISRDYANSLQEPMLEDERTRLKRLEREKNTQHPSYGLLPEQELQ